MERIFPGDKMGALMYKAAQGAAVFGELDQEHVDRIVRPVFEAGYNRRVDLAKKAAEDTGIGRWQDMVIKNVVGGHFRQMNIR
jgi:acetaldehyde dehydrogenase (acetylating)